MDPQPGKRSCDSSKAAVSKLWSFVQKEEPLLRRPIYWRFIQDREARFQTSPNHFLLSTSFGGFYQIYVCTHRLYNTGRQMYSSVLAINIEGWKATKIADSGQWWLEKNYGSIGKPNRTVILKPEFKQPRCFNFQ